MLDMELAGFSWMGEKTIDLNRVVWNNTETILQDAQSDVLGTFDCCYAGSLTMTRGGPPEFGRLAATSAGPTDPFAAGQSITSAYYAGSLATARGGIRRFEYLTASSAESTTPCPGNRSFTSALIWALKRLSEVEGHFTTGDLLKRIVDCAPHFDRNQRPILSKRLPTHNTLIALEALKNVNNSAGPLPLDDMSDGTTANKQTLTLHFDFDNPPRADEMKFLKRNLGDLLRQSSLQIDRIRWGDMQPRQHGSDDLSKDEEVQIIR